MYRPNRIGPWPLVDLNGSTGELIADATISAAMSTSVLPQTITQDTTVNLVRRSSHMYSDGSVAFPTQQGFAFGAKISGTMVGPNDVPYQLSVAGACWWITDVVDSFVCIPFVGRTSENDANFSTEIYRVVPAETVQYPAAVDNAGYIGVNTSLVEGLFNAAYSRLYTQLVFGFWFRNLSAGSANVTCGASMSIERYLEDVPTFDPNR